MEDILRSSLDKEEEILWRGHAEPFQTLDKTHKADFIRKAMIGAAIVIAVLVFLFSMGKFESKFLILIGIVLLLCVIPAANVFSDASKLRKIEYIATTERLIVLRDALRSAYYSQIKTGAFREDLDGHVSLVCGPDAMKARPYKRREICVVGAGVSESDSECSRFCFYAPTDRETLEKILHERMPSLF